jgi:hypothetical protein
MDSGNIFSQFGPLFFTLTGFYVFFHGFKEFRGKRLVEDIPTSTIRGLAMGIVEVIGIAKSKKILKSPLTSTDCVFYKYLIEEYVRRGKSKHWIPHLKGDSSLIPFYIEDGTGEILVLPLGARYIMPEDYLYESYSFQPFPDNLIHFSQRFSISLKNLFTMNRKLRFREWYIQENDQVYVLGYAQKSTDIYEKLKNEKKLIARKIKRDSYFQSNFDVDKNGRIDERELRAAETNILSAILGESNAKMSDLHDVIIATDPRKKTFILSDQSQKNVTKKLKNKFITEIMIGALMILAGIFYLLRTN